jgi:hypothetical protein
MYLQADKPLFSSSFVHDRGYGGIPPEELSAPAAEHEAALEGPIKRRKKRSLKPPVHLYQFFTIFSLISSTFSFGIEVQNVVELIRVGQAAGVPHRRVHVETYVYQLADD